jgi:4-amino-4-deoxy-L-arabinose transferase-like glycosyltransferase
MFQDPKRCARITALVLAVVYAASISPHWRLGRDSAMFLGLARSLAEGDGYTFGGFPYSGVPFGLPVLLSLVWRLFGENYLVMNAMMACLALATLWLVYRTVEELAGPWWGVIVAALAGLSYRMVQFSSQIMSDMPATCCIWAGLYFAQRVVRCESSGWGSATAAGAAIAAGCMFRLSTPFVLPALALAPWLRPKTSRLAPGARAAMSALLVLPAVIAVAAWWKFQPTHQAGGDPAGTYSVSSGAGTAGAILRRLLPNSVILLDSAFEVMTSQGWNAEHLLDGRNRRVGRAVVTGVALLAMTGLLAMGAWRVTRQDRGLGVTTVVCYGAGIVLFADPIPRYLLPVLPFLFWWMAAGLQAALRRDAAAPFPLGRPVLAVLAVVVALNLAKVQKSVVVALRSDYYAHYDRGAWKPYVEAARWIRANTPADARVVTQETSVMAYLTDRTVLDDPRAGRPGDVFVFKQGKSGVARYENTVDAGLDRPRALEAAWKELAGSSGVQAVFRSGEVVVFQSVSGR